MEAYLDNSATTPVSQGVKEIVIKTMMEDYGNPSSMHMKGVEAERYLRQAKEILAKILKVNEKEIIFTSGGTESNNLALIGIANANHRAGKHIITTSVEHASVLNTVKYLEEQGFEVTWLPVDEHGHIRLETGPRKDLDCQGPQKRKAKARCRPKGSLLPSPAFLSSEHRVLPVKMDQHRGSRHSPEKCVPEDHILSKNHGLPQGKLDQAGHSQQPEHRHKKSPNPYLHIFSSFLPAYLTTFFRPFPLVSRHFPALPVICS